MKLCPRIIGCLPDLMEGSEAYAKVHLRTKHRSLPEALGRNDRCKLSTHARVFAAVGELAVLNSTRTGVDASPLDEHRRRVVDTRSIRLQIQSEFERSCHPYMLLDPGPGLKIIDINAAYAAATFISRSDVVGKSLFEVFPDNPTDALADGVSNLYASL